MDFIQANSSYKFSTDALLLANFAGARLAENFFSKKRGLNPPFLFLDLGCASGIVGLCFLQYIAKYLPDFYKDTYVLGIDKEEILIETAHINARNFIAKNVATHKNICIMENYHAICGEIPSFEAIQKYKKSSLAKKIQDWYLKIIVSTQCEEHEAKKNQKKVDDGVLKNPYIFDAVLTNPPWYQKCKGKQSPKPLRNSALFGEKNTLNDFFAFSENVLKPKGSLYTVGKPSIFLQYVDKMPKSMRCVCLQNVYHEKNKNANFFLLEAKKQSKADMTFLEAKIITKT